MKKLFFILLVVAFTCNCSYTMKHTCPTEKLFEAAKNGEMEKAKLLLEDHQAFNHHHDLYVAAQKAICNGHPKLASFLLEEFNKYQFLQRKTRRRNEVEVLKESFYELNL